MMRNSNKDDIYGIANMAIYIYTKPSLKSKKYYAIDTEHNLFKKYGDQILQQFRVDIISSPNTKQCTLTVKRPIKFIIYNGILEIQVTPSARSCNRTISSIRLLTYLLLLF